MPIAKSWTSFLLFVYLFHFISMASAADIAIDAYGMFFNQSIFETLDIIGLKQCVRECQSRGDCKAVNYKRDDLQCQLLWTSASNSLELQINDKYQYITMESQTTVRTCTKKNKNFITSIILTISKEDSDFFHYRVLLLYLLICNYVI